MSAYFPRVPSGNHHLFDVVWVNANNRFPISKRSRRDRCGRGRVWRCLLNFLLEELFLAKLDQQIIDELIAIRTIDKETLGDLRHHFNMIERKLDVIVVMATLKFFIGIPLIAFTLWHFW